MPATAQLLEQRSQGQVLLQMAEAGPVRLRESGAAKIRLPHGSTEAILINTGGGLAGGDRFDFEFSCGPKSKLTVTSQAAERVYRTLGPPAQLHTRITLAAQSSLSWLPQETIIYDGAAITRNYTVDLAAGTTFLAVEAIVFGRTEMGERVNRIQLHDRWRIMREGKLVHADDLHIGDDLPNTPATLQGNFAMATLVYCAADVEQRLEGIRIRLGKKGGVSAWNGKLIARVLAKDGFHLRKALIPVLQLFEDHVKLPKIWTA